MCLDGHGVFGSRLRRVHDFGGGGVLQVESDAENGFCSHSDLFDRWSGICGLSSDDPAANHRETDTLNLLNLIMLLVSSIEFVVSCGTLIVVMDVETTVHRDSLARPSFALRIAVYASHILFGVVILLVQFIAYLYDLRMKIRFYDVGVLMGLFNGGIGVVGVVIAVCCVGVSSDRAFRFVSSIIGVVLSVVFLGFSMDDLPASLLWCYDDDRQWFKVALYLALLTSSFYEIFIFFFFLRISFFDPSPKSADAIRTRIRDSTNPEPGVTSCTPGSVLP